MYRCTRVRRLRLGAAPALVVSLTQVHAARAGIAPRLVAGRKLTHDLQAKEAAPIRCQRSQAGASRGRSEIVVRELVEGRGRAVHDFRQRRFLDSCLTSHPLAAPIPDSPLLASQRPSRLAAIAHPRQNAVSRVRRRCSPSITRETRKDSSPYPSYLNNIPPHRLQVLLRRSVRRGLGVDVRIAVDRCVCRCEARVRISTYPTHEKDGRTHIRRSRCTCTLQLRSAPPPARSCR